VVKAYVHNQGACEDSDFLRDGWAAGGRVEKVIVYCIIEDKSSISAGRILVLMFDSDPSLISEVTLKHRVLDQVYIESILLNDTG